MPYIVSKLLRCWAILLVPALLVLIAVFTEQGRDAVAVVSSSKEIFGKGYHAYASQAVTTILSTLAPVVILTRLPTSDRGRFANYHVSGLIGLIAGFLPIVVLQENGVLADAAPTDVVLFFVLGSLAALALVVIFRGIILWQPQTDERLASRFSARWAAAFALALALTALIAMVGRAWMALAVAVVALVIIDLLWWRSAASSPVGWRRWIAIGVAVFAIGGAWLVAVGPTNWGLSIGSYSVLLVALNFWLAIGFLLNVGLRKPLLCVRHAVSSRCFGPHVGVVLRILPAAIALFIVWRFVTGPFDLREVRFLEVQQDPSPTTELQKHALKWLEARRAEVARSGACYPIFVVNADGGGVRAAWWSATILSALQDRQTRFKDRVFAISGVSGGSLGAAVFAARAADSPAPGSPCGDKPWRDCADAILARDLLGPPVGAMVIGDTLRAISRLDWFPDRATAIEEAFERAWLDAFGRNTFGEPFTQLWTGGRATTVPALLLNATETSTGRRLVLGPVKLFDPNVERGDLGVLVGKRALRLSTAVLLSARFPGVSPAGWLPRDESAKPTDKSVRFGTAIVDGGLSDNSGAASAEDAMAAVKAAAVQLKMHNVLPIALMIANSPVSSTPRPAVPEPGARSDFSATTLGSLIWPVATLDRLRQQRTARAKRDYQTAVVNAGGLVLDGFDLRADGNAYPLGWMLAERTRSDMKRQVDVMAQNPTSDFSAAERLSRGRPCGDDGLAP